jgi:Flp pilus assembly protein TadG
VEFALVISVFLLVVFSGIEVSRAIYQKHALARAAEAIVKELAQTNPDKQPLDAATGNPVPYTMSFADVSTAIADANTQAGLGLSTVWPPASAGYATVADLPGSLLAGTGCDATYGIDPSTNPEPCYGYDAATGYCDLPATDTLEACQAASNQDGSVEIIG